MGNIAYRLGRATPNGEIAERLRGRKDFAEAFGKMQLHLEANGIDLGKTQAVLGPWLSMDPEKEQFVREFGVEANRLATRAYRQPFVVPEKV